MEQSTTTTDVTADIISGVALQIERSILTLDVTISNIEDTTAWTEVSTARSQLASALKRLDTAGSALRVGHEIDRLS